MFDVVDRVLELAVARGARDVEVYAERGVSRRIKVYGGDAVENHAEMKAFEAAPKTKNYHPRGCPALLLKKDVGKISPILAHAWVGIPQDFQ